MHFYCVFGNPISHSKSPILHNYVFYKLNINARYNRHLLKNDNNFRDMFLKHEYVGANVTLPFKETVVKYCDRIHGIANEIGAINTIIKDDNKLIGYNTDASGFYKCIESYNIKNALIIGAGGSAKAIACILKNKNINIMVINRSINRLDFFKAKNIKCINIFELDIIKEVKFDLVINATSSSLNNELPLEIGLLKTLFLNARIAFDLVYGTCKFLELAKQYELITIDGSKMLLYQAIDASSLFLNKPNETIANIMYEVFHIVFDT